MQESNQLQGTLHGNTGLDLQATRGHFEISCDYLTVCGRLSSLDRVHEELGRVAYRFLEDGALVISEDKGIWKGRYYKHTASTPSGIHCAYTPTSQNDSYHVRISIPAKSIRRIHQMLFWMECKRLNSIGLLPTRFDVALDDFEKRLEPETLLAAIAEGDHYHFRNAKFISQVGSKQGFTLYMGSRQSVKMVRYYDKDAESKGEINSYRLEVEAKDEYAASLWSIMLMPHEWDEDHYRELLLECVIGAIDFRDRTADSNQSRCPRLCWWQCFIDDCSSSGGLRLPRPAQKSSVSKTVTWVRRQVETSLAMLRDIMGSAGFRDFVTDCVESGRRRYSRQHEAVLHLFRNGCDALDFAALSAPPSVAIGDY
jgi:Replication initiation factor